MSQVDFPKGETIFREGDPGTHCYRIILGKVQVSIDLPGVMRRDRKTAIAICGPGEFIGEMSLLIGSARSATLTAIEDTTCETFTKSQLMDLLESNPKEAMAYLKILIARIREDNRKLSITYGGRG
jgi:CRP/FNR family cyclic AMP-dependent transcriptional regulator